MWGRRYACSAHLGRGGAALARRRRAPNRCTNHAICPGGIGKAACQPTGDQHLAEALATASVQQKNAHANDTAGVILLGLPLASMSGENIAPQIAALKGEQEAVGQAMQFGNCGT